MKCSEINEWLDLLMDDAMSDDMRRELDEHGRTCQDCAQKIQATLEMKALFDQMEDEVDVPLPVQARWRNAVRAEASRRLRNRIYRIAGTVAAAVVLVIGVGWALNGDMGLKPSDTDVVLRDAKEETDDLQMVGAPVVEADGQDTPAASSTARAMIAEGVPLHECHLTVENLDDACDYICDLVAEYEGAADEQRLEENGVAKANVYVTMPAGNVEDFLSAAGHLNVSEDPIETLIVDEGETSSLLLVLSMQG